MTDHSQQHTPRDLEGAVAISMYSDSVMTTAASIGIPLVATVLFSPAGVACAEHLQTAAERDELTKAMRGMADHLDQMDLP